MTRIVAVPATWTHPRGADGRYIPQDPPPVVVYLDIDGVINDDAYLSRPEVRAAQAAAWRAAADPSARAGHAAVTIDPQRAACVASVLRDAGAQVWVCSAWRHAYGHAATATALEARGIRVTGCLSRCGLSSTRVHDIRRHLLDLPPGTLAVVLDDQVGADAMEGTAAVCVAPDDGVTLADLAELRRALDVAWVAYADGLPVSARCASREEVLAWLEANAADAAAVDASGLADPPAAPPPPEPTLWDRLHPLLGERPQSARALAAALAESTPRVAQALHAHRHLVQGSGRRGRRAYRPRWCEGGCGPAVTSDGDGVPLCQACADMLDAEGAVADGGAA